MVMAVIGGMVALAAAAPTWGADSRPSLADDHGPQPQAR